MLDLGAQNSTSKIMYTQVNAKIERNTEISMYILNITVCSGMFATLCECYVNYYIFDLKEDSFIMPVPTWYIS